MWDIKRIVLFIGSLFVVILLSMSMASATETGKSKAEWNALYVEAGCMELNFFQREICKTKVFQKTNWQSGKDQLNNTLKKIGVN